MAIYKAAIEERNGDRDYAHEFYVVANSPEDAQECAEYYADDWYENSEGPNEDGWYETDGGAIAWRLDYVIEVDSIFAYNADGGFAKLKLVEVRGEAI